MLRSIALSLSFVLVAACGGSEKPSESTTPTNETAQTAEPAPTDQTTPCETPAEGPMSSDQCTCQGGQVRGDIGDGKIKCEAGESELGRVATGIEGGVCCAPAEQAAPAAPAPTTP